MDEWRSWSENKEGSQRKEKKKVGGNELTLRDQSGYGLESGKKGADGRRRTNEKERLKQQEKREREDGKWESRKWVLLLWYVVVWIKM